MLLSPRPPVANGPPNPGHKGRGGTQRLACQPVMPTGGVPATVRPLASWPQPAVSAGCASIDGCLFHETGHCLPGPHPTSAQHPPHQRAFSFTLSHVDVRGVGKHQVLGSKCLEFKSQPHHVLAVGPQLLYALVCSSVNRSKCLFHRVIIRTSKYKENGPSKCFNHINA